jgi:hypothetical protein
MVQNKTLLLMLKVSMYISCRSKERKSSSRWVLLVRRPGGCRHDELKRRHDEGFRGETERGETERERLITFVKLQRPLKPVYG